MEDGDKDHGNDGDGEDGVGEENGEVDGAKPLGLLEGGAPGVVVVVEVAGEKEGGGDERADHAVAVGVLASALDEDVTEGEEDGADAVEAGVDGWKVGEVHGLDPRSEHSLSGRGG